MQDDFPGRPIDPDNAPDSLRGFVETRGNFFQIESFRIDNHKDLISTIPAVADQRFMVITLQPYPIDEQAKSLSTVRVAADADVADKLGWALLEEAKKIRADP